MLEYNSQVTLLFYCSELCAVTVNCWNVFKTFGGRLLWQNVMITVSSVLTIRCQSVSHFVLNVLLVLGGAGSVVGMVLL